MINPTVTKLRNKVAELESQIAEFQHMKKTFEFELDKHIKYAELQRNNQSELKADIAELEFQAKSFKKSLITLSIVALVIGFAAGFTLSMLIL